MYFLEEKFCEVVNKIDIEQSTKPFTYFINLFESKMFFCNIKYVKDIRLHLGVGFNLKMIGMIYNKLKKDIESSMRKKLLEILEVEFE